MANPATPVIGIHGKRNTTLSAGEAVLLIVIVGAIALTLPFQNVIPEWHRTGQAPSEQSAALPQLGPGG